MYRLSRGQLVGLVTIALIFAIAAFIFDKIIDYKSNKVDYITYDKTISSTLLKGNYIEYVNLGSEYKEEGVNTKKDYTISYLKNGDCSGFKKITCSRVWWCTPLILALGRQRQVDF